MIWTLFYKSSTKQSKYRFSFKDICSVVEKLKLNPSLLNTLLTQMGVIPYRGVTNISKMDNVPAGSTSHKAKALGIQFAVPKQL
jgi:hypothetical protein